MLKVMFAFSLLDHRCGLPMAALPAYRASVPLYGDFNARHFQLGNGDLAGLIVGELERSGAAKMAEGWIDPA